ncbi:MAG: carbohydrate kinase [Myxococcales bacterium]|nr:carbohydrate kinase [Myxococcales bacterium]
MPPRAPRPRRPAYEVSCFGEVLWDIFELDAPGRAAGARFVREIGGAPANVATVLGRLGVRVRLAGAVGRDRFGQDLKAAIAAEGVDVDTLLELPNRTGLAFVRRDASGEPSFLFYRHDTADVALRKTDVVPAMADASFVLVGTSTLMRPGLRAATMALVAASRRAEAGLFVDLNVRAHMWGDLAEMRRRVGALVAHAAIVKASAGDLVALGGSLRRGEAWLTANAPRAVQVHTRGGSVAWVRGPFGTIEVAVPRPDAPCVDATGAGDAFVAGVLAWLVASGAVPSSPAFADPDTWRGALTLGHRLGEKAIARPGAVKGVTGLGKLVHGLNARRRGESR